MMAESKENVSTVNTTEESEYWDEEIIERYRTVIIVQVAYLSFLCVFGTTLNMIVIFRALRYRNSLLTSGTYRKISIDSTNMFVISLAIANLGTSTFSIGLIILPLYFKNIPVTNFACRFIWPIRELFYAVSCFSLTLIAVSRYFILFKTFQNRKIFRYPILNNIVLWLFCYFVFAFPYSRGYKPEQVNDILICDTTNWSTLQEERGYITFVVVAHVVIPTMFVGISYIGIITRLKHASNMIAPLSTIKMAHPNEDMLSTVVKSHRAVKISLLLLLSYMITFIPIACLLLFLQYKEITEDMFPEIEYIYVICTCLVNSGVVMDPVILMLSNRGYRPNLRALKNCFQT
ncbi:QRFP-like peptide receptor [Xenia sp. Carnegie-2017]|uniref:QRFP-like peptide receptor n=1 Tax=Xenia sp. Carnegie-2017 TaxID=2897299 RepID=UPI001F045E3B|nr:QRFP-like peptide receptor [Xenia sp. Carnegie-2017]